MNSEKLTHSSQTIHYNLPIFWQKVGWLLFNCLYKIFLRLEISGKENLVGLDGPLILASNHTSELDATLMPLLLPFFSKLYPIYFVANPMEKYKTFGWRGYIYGAFFFNMMGGYSVFSGHHDYSIALETHEMILKNGGTVCIFPEGKRTLDGMTNPARGGLGYLVWSTKATVVPVSIDTFFHISPLEFFTGKRKVRVRIGKAMKANEITGDLRPETPTVETFRQWSQKVLDKVKEKIN